MVALLESIKLPREHKKLAVADELPANEEIDGVLSTVVSEGVDYSALGRKLPTFDTHDLT